MRFALATFEFARNNSGVRRSRDTRIQEKNMQLSVFKEVDLFADLSDDHMQVLAEHAAARHYKKNAIVLTTGDESDSMYVVIKGLVRVYLDDEKGNEITLTTLGPGECFGELALLSGEPRVANVMTLEDCQFAVISKQDLMQILNDDPKIAFGVIRALVKRIQSMTEDISSLALLDVYGRIARTLNKNARERNGRMITNRMTQ